MSRVIALFLAIFLTPLSVFAGPPILTDDTGTPGPGKWETNMGFTVEKRQDTTLYNVPALDLNYGVGERIQLNYSVSWVVLHASGEGSISGLGNSEVAVKWRFLDEDKNGMAMSVYPRFIFNNPVSSADRGLVDKGTVFRLPFQMEKKIGMLIINPEIGHDFRQEGGDIWQYALALKYDEIKGLEVLVEVFGTADNSFKKQENVVNIGVRKDVSEDVSLHASVGRSLHQAPDQPSLLSYVGLQLRF
jgi:outer membrane putative beta-barrel porin/alpha-amylase